jgi:DNA repair and recombination protein RAD54B
VLVTSYERIRILTAELKKLKFDLIVCDEGHRLKDSSTKAVHVHISFHSSEADINR